MKFHDLVQGTDEWKAFRKDHLPASDLPAVAGVSKYVKRHDLMHRYATGEEMEVTPTLQRLFDRGHKAEAKARKILEDRLGVVFTTPTVSARIDGLDLSASLDGFAFEINALFEHKLWNQKVAESILMARENEDLTYIAEQYIYQIQQQLLITSASECIFVCSDGTEDNWEEIAIKADPKYQEIIVGYWEHFLSNLSQYNPDEIAPAKPASASIMELPALQIEAKGFVGEGTLKHYYRHGMEFIDSIKTELETDEDYADAEALVKFCTASEKDIAGAKQEIITRIDGLAEAFDMMDEISGGLRGKRLALNKAVKGRKDQIKADLVAEFAEMVTAKSELEPDYIDEQLKLAIKSKRTLPTMRDALNVKVGELIMEDKPEPVKDKSPLLEALGEWSEKHNIKLDALHELEDILKLHAEVTL